MATNLENIPTFLHGNMSSSVFDSPCPSVASDKQDVIIVLDDDDSDIEIDEISSTNVNEKQRQSQYAVKMKMNKLNLHEQIIVVKANLPVRVCQTAIPYPDLEDIHILTIYSPHSAIPEHVTKRQVYMNEPCLLSDIPSRSRVFHRATSLLGFVLEAACATTNNYRCLVLYDDFTACYHSSSDLHLCLCQDFRRHLLNIDFKELRNHYQKVFNDSQNATETSHVMNSVIRVRKFGGQYHNVRVIDIDQLLIKICFFERKSKKEMWIHCNSSIIEQSQPNTQSLIELIPVDPPTPTDDSLDSDLPRLRKRKTDENNKNRKGGKKLRDRSNTRQLLLSINDDVSLEAHQNILTTYYTNILLPKFRALNALPSAVHKCGQQCVQSAEENFCPSRIRYNPFLLPFECQWSVVDSKPRGYRTPCRRTLYSLDDIEQYLYRTQSKLSIKYFVDGVLTRFKPPIDNQDRNCILSDDLSNGQENVQVSVYNDIDNEKPDNFVYITKIQPIDSRIAAALNDTNMTSCCDCTDNCSDRMKCACFRKTLTQAQVNRDPLVMEKEKYRYTQSHMLKTTGYQRKRLLNSISSGIYECNSKCSCHREHCSNRLVQQGVFVHLQLFKDKLKGWGLRTLHDLPRGTFVCQYIGELLTSDQGHERAQTMDDKYQTSLDIVKQVRYEISNEDDMDDDDDDEEEPYVIDGSLYSNLGKYFNHSCDPNMFIQNVFIESHDLHFPNLALFTHTHIKAGQVNRSNLATPFFLQQSRQNSIRANHKTSIHSLITILPNASLSSSQSTDESSTSTIHHPASSANTLQLFRRMLSIRRSSSTKPSIYHSYNLRAFDVARDHYEITVHFLDDTERTFHVERRGKGSDVLNEIFDYLDLTTERKYFGLLIEDLTQDFAYQWLDATKPLKKQFAPNMTSHHLYFKVRFFLIDPTTQIDDEFTKYLFVLQIKKELLSGKIWCPRVVAIRLASYIVQSELGDYDVNAHHHGYLKDFRFVPFQNKDFEDEVELYHKQHQGQLPADAESNYLRIASSLDMYGVELHKSSVKVSHTNETNYNSIVELYVGVSAVGISVFQNSTKINTFLWDQITKISFKRRTFYVQLVKNMELSDDNSIVFTLRNYRCCKYLWKSCVDHHTFFRLTTTAVAAVASSSPKRLFSFSNKLRHKNESSNLPSNSSLMETIEKKPKVFERVSSQRNKGAINENLPSIESSDEPTPKLANLVDNTSSIPPPKPPRLISKQSLTTTVILEANEYKPKNAIQSRESLQNPPTTNCSMSCMTTDATQIKLTPDADGRYGFNVKKGENEQTPTVISKVAHNTPASRASIHEGDIILAINNIDIRNHSHDQITEMVRHSRERPSAELELLMKPREEQNSLEKSVQILRSDLKSEQLVEQYEALQRRKDGFTFEISTNQINFYCNRYKDVLPYDQTRVILKTSLENDYINASYINMPIISTDTVNRYIATQGPLPTTCEAFWRMVWEQQCTLIIMLTTLFENGRVKCHQYWPNVLETIDYGLFRIRCNRERNENNLMYRELICLNKESHEERIIYQIQNEIWPDHGVPTDYASFVDFVLEIRELRKANKHLPILVHCSAGIGRTGVLILVETALCLMENNQPVFPLNIVRQTREQRLGMIQTASQYQFACEAILYAYDHGLIEINNN
ncbi:unnamed protein product [Adineta ricciae]|nr:unnamed protein product [Adineta ricciae]